MKKAVVTVTIGDEYKRLAEMTHPLMRAYAEKIGAEFIVIGESKVSETVRAYEKFQLFDYLKVYPRIIFLDTDVIVRPDCPDLFQIVPEHSLGVFNDGRFTDYTPVMREACMKYVVSLPKWERQYYNTGVMVLSRLHRHFFHKPEAEHTEFAGRKLNEEPFLNLKIVSEGYKVQELSYKFNRMSLMDGTTGEHRLSSYIVHYASIPTAEIREDYIKKDLASWEGTAPQYWYQKNIHVDVGGGLGDQIDAEPVVRYMCEKAYKGDNIRVRTHFPEIFAHLPVTVVNSNNVKGDTRAYYFMETLPPPEKPLWQHLSHPLCHTIDFASISTLRRTLSDADKQIVLHPSPDDTVSMLLSVGGVDISGMTLVHPGRGWESKTFPTSWWQGIIDGLAAAGIPTAIIGKYLSTEQGLVDLRCPEGVHDYRNLFSLGELMAIIGQSKCLISNDSAPVHIAGAFDTWIVLIPSCKHPDHVLPYRKGSKLHRTVTLYKKLTCEAIDSLPTQVDGQTIDTVVGDILEYLPDPQEVINSVASIYLAKGQG